MGKNKMFKQLRKEASRLRMEVRTAGEERKYVVPGWKLLRAGHTECQGEPIDPKKQYNCSYQEKTYVNHLRNLKRAYYGKGIDGAVEYIESAQERAKLRENPTNTSNQINTEGVKNISWPGM